jgi:quercetin dioxygenase-like cupin family protein
MHPGGLAGMVDHQTTPELDISTLRVHGSPGRWCPMAVRVDDDIYLLPTRRRPAQLKHTGEKSATEGTTMKITQSSTNTAQGPADWFTGAVLIDTVRNPDQQTAIGCAHVRFAPGARTAWHTHPKGQTLYVTDGIGLVNRRGGNPVEIRPGDVVYIEPGEEHWHGATPTRFMAHVAMHEADEHGQVVTWLDQVTDDQYNSAR